MRRELSFYFDTLLRFSDFVTEHNFLLRVIPPDVPEQKILSRKVAISPETSPRHESANVGFDAFGNQFYAGRIAERHREFRYTLQGVAYRDDALRERGTAAAFYRYPSPLAFPTDGLEAFFRSSSISGNRLETAKHLSRKVHEHFTYAPGATGIATTAGEAFRLGRGVCQDYAHVLIALCRMAGIPARYVSGLPMGEGASHAWVEIWDEGLWHGLDPTRGRMADESYLKLCVGRDYGDCPVERGVFSGCADQTQTVFMKVTDE